MCGITGVFAFAASARDELANVRRMRDTMIHRGPDDSGLWEDRARGITLGHRRLSIVDLSAAGRQPLSNEDGNVQLTFNGEIYNHERLREALLERGHQFRSRSDGEAIVHAYEEHGANVVRLLDGMFAFGLWDAHAGQLLLARDRLGKKPLHYIEIGGRLLFASEIKALLAHPDVSREVDPVALDHYLTFGNVPAPRTLFDRIRKLPPGHLLRCSRKSGVEVTRYWSAVDDRVPELASDEDASDRVLALLRAAVSKRMMSDVPIGALLSGGIDSSTNVALMSELVDRPLRTFSIGFTGFGAGENFHDLPFARQVAERFGCEHTEINIGAAECRAQIPELAGELDEPIGDPACLPMHFASRAVREAGVTVVLVGEGSDEVFGGYEDLVHMLRVARPRFELIRKLPRGMRVALYRAAQLVRAAPGRIDVLRRAAHDEPLYWGLDVAFWDAEKRALMARRGSPGLTSSEIVQGYYRELAARRPDADPLQQWSWVELCNRLPELLLARVDRMTMAHSLEARAPFLDADLVAFAFSLPTHLKIRGGTTKYVLKQAVRKLLPASIITRRKQGFRVPLPEWLRGELSGWALHCLRDARIMKSGLFRRDAIERMWARHHAGTQDHSFDLWCLIQLAAWHERWIERR